MTCDVCGRPLTLKGDVVVWLPSGAFRCFPCWLAEASDLEGDTNE